MIVKNEAAVLGRCLASIKPAADEIIVVDTGSDDATIAVAEGFTTHVVRSDWKNDFSYSRNLSIRDASSEWILWLDADDVVPANSLPIISDLKKKQSDKVFGFVIRNEKPGATGTEFIQARMFPNRPEIFFERRIHEQMMPSALRQGLKLIETNAVIEHHGYADPVEMGRKVLRNIPLLLAEYAERGPDAVMAVELGDSYLVASENDQAAQWYERVLQIPDCETVFPEIASQAYLGLGNICNTRADYASAMGHLQKALKLCPQRVDALFSLAVSYELLHRLPDAIDCLYSIIRFSPVRRKIGIDFREAKIKSYLRLGRLLMDSQQTDDALKLASRAVSELPHRPEIHAMSGRLFFRCNKLMEALHAFEKSLEIDKFRNIDAYAGLCHVYVIAGKKATAEKTLETLLPAFKDSPRFWALYKHINGSLPENLVPGAIDRAAIIQEETMLRQSYARR